MGNFTDGKYGRVVLGSKTNTREDDEPVFVFLARDRKAPFVLDAYARMLEESADVDDEFVHGVYVAAERMRSWQQDHPDLVKVPD